MADERAILLALHQMDGIGWKTILRLRSASVTLQRLCEKGWVQVEEVGVEPQKAEHIRRVLTPAYAEQVKARYSEAGITVVTIDDDKYPPLLRETSSPPWVLYAIGEVSLLQRPSVAVVGTRTPTVYGQKVAADLSSALSKSGLCIVSGLARGIDSRAHEGALQGSGGTIGVLGCGIDAVYPPENRGLYERIKSDGLLLSEYPMGIPPHPGLFPQRNRIIAGMTLGTVVVEAAERSGSLITADQALDESRDVFAVPGPITSPKSLGVLSLIKQGAKLVTCANDILEEYAHLLPASSTVSRGGPVDPHEGLSEDERGILDLLSHEPVTIDRLLERSQTNFGHLHAILLSLQLKKKIEQVPGSAYIMI